MGQKQGHWGCDRKRGQTLTILSGPQFSHLFIRNELTHSGVRTRDKHVGSLRPVESELPTHLEADMPGSSLSS